MMITDNVYKNLIAFHPGEYISDLIEDLNMTQAEFAKRLGTTPKTISKIINGEAPVSVDIASRLDKLTGISYDTWMNLQATYEKKILEIEEMKKDDEEKICRKIDFSYFKNNGYLPNKRYSLNDKIIELRKLLNVVNLTFLAEFNANVSYRNTQEFKETSIINSNVMLELANNEARNKTQNKYDKRKLESRLPEIKKMTFQKPNDFLPKLTELLLEAGIVLVLLPNLSKTNLNGAVKRFKNGSVMLLVTDRYKQADIFWFSLLHELGHIYNHDFNSDYKDEKTYNELEKRADEFAQEYFIPKDIYQKFVESNRFNRYSIESVADKCGIDSGIVVGRLQHEGLIGRNKFNDLRITYDLKEISST